MITSAQAQNTENQDFKRVTTLFGKVTKDWGRKWPYGLLNEAEEDKIVILNHILI
ncbi:MAG: hypothetical protein NPIRA06_04950 [Nitrospirales bacterium]|nr:MAG: hypothetical protein NPIRA06_04950 [Nitrospirales bacterium]